MKILVTGFDPFGGESINPAFEVLKLLPQHIKGASVRVLEIPTVFYESFRVLSEVMESLQPDIVLCVGQAGGRSALTFEKVAINVNDARIKDNLGQQFIDTPIVPEGDTAYFTNLPIKAMVEAVRQAGIPASVSFTAGTYVCNHIFYMLMHGIATKYPKVRGGFLHVPYCEAQAVSKPNEPSMSLVSIAKGIACALEVAIDVHEDVKITGGQEH